MTEDLTLHPIDWGIVGPALVAGLLVLISHVPLGLRVLRKGIVFIDLAIAQIAGLGVITADAMGFEPQGWGVQCSAVGAALLGAALLTWTERHWPDIQEALIGCLFVVASSVSLLMLAGNPHGGEHLKDLLVGQILWVTPGQLWAMAGVTAGVLAGLWALRHAPSHWQGWGFYTLFALAVTASVQLVGVYLVFASLIMPALAVRRLPRGPRALMTGLGVGALGYVTGLSLSAMADWPSGAVVVLALAAAACLTAAGLTPGALAKPAGAPTST